MSVEELSLPLHPKKPIARRPAIREMGKMFVNDFIFDLLFFWFYHHPISSTKKLPSDI